MYVCVCIVCISVYCMNMCVLYVLLVYTCIACIWMDGLYCVYSVYLHVSACIVCIGNIVCMCMYCLYMSVYLETFFQIHTHTYTYRHIHTIQTKYRYVANACMCMYFRVNTYIIQTAGFTYIQIQTCRIPDVLRNLYLWFCTWPGPEIKTIPKQFDTTRQPLMQRAVPQPLAPL